MQKDLRANANPNKAVALQRFFKTGKGEYGEGDRFLGLVVPQIRGFVETYYKELEFGDIETLITSPFHEERLLALLVLVKKFENADKTGRKKIYDFYLRHLKYINNWDLVDLSAPKIVGAYLFEKDRTKLFTLAHSKNLWSRRVAILSTFYFIYNGDYSDALKISLILKDDREDLIHKAVGWMLREIGKRCSVEAEEEFLKKHYRTMPRTMLRYAIERFPEAKRKSYLAK